MTAKEHYDKHLGTFYSWMTGNIHEKQKEHQQIFKSLGLNPKSDDVVVDLGCGHGIQTLALAHLGYRVIGVDFNKQLLTELINLKGELPIETYDSDLLTFLETWNGNASVVTCMGDTLTHLESVDAVGKLFRLISIKLLPGGKLILSFRDLTVELKNGSRFIPVRADDQRILTCFLEYRDDSVMVHDLLWEKTDNGWTQKVSSYPKLRLSADRVCELLEQAGLKVTFSKEINRMNFLVAEKDHSSTH